MALSPEQSQLARQLVGDISTEQLRHVDCYLSPLLGVFVPLTGYCGYAITPWHEHPSWSFVISRDDQASVITRAGEFAMPAGRLFAMAPDMPHHERQRDTHSSYTAIMIAPSLWAAITEGESGIEDMDCRDVALPAILPALLADFMTETSSPGGGSLTMLDALARVIALHIRRAFAGGQAGTSLPVRREEIRRVIDYIAQNSGKELRLDTLAMISGWSLSHFSRMFRSETGYSPAEYLLRERLEKARRMLLGSEATLTVIAHECGFADSSHFCASFRRRYGLVPSEFRKRNTWQNNTKLKSADTRQCRGCVLARSSLQEV